MRIYHHLALATSIALAGCQAVTYTTEVSEDFEGKYKINLQSQDLLLTYEDLDKRTGVSLQSVPTQSDANRFAVVPTDNWFETTRLQITKRPGTDVVSSITVSTESNAVKTMETLGAIALTLIPVLFTNDGSGSTPAQFPIAFDTEVLLADAGRNEAPGIKGTAGGYDIVMDVGAVPKDAITVAQLKEKIFNKRTDVFFYSACRTAKVLVTPPAAKAGVAVAVPGPLVFTTLISDPNYVQLIKLPEAGVYTAQPTCGADITSTPSGTDSTLTILNKFIAQVKALSDAYKTEKGTAATKKAAVLDKTAPAVAEAGS